SNCIVRNGADGRLPNKLAAPIPPITPTQPAAPAASQNIGHRRMLRGDTGDVIALRESSMSRRAAVAESSRSLGFLCKHRFRRLRTAPGVSFGSRDQSGSVFTM